MFFSCFVVFLRSNFFFRFFCVACFHSEITLVIKRLVKRETINVKFELPGGTRDHEIKAGSNLRGEMIRLDVPVSFLFTLNAVVVRYTRDRIQQQRIGYPLAKMRLDIFIKREQALGRWRECVTSNTRVRLGSYVGYLPKRAVSR